MIVGTAGHIDHGKTTLVRALTGVDTDRLKEEKERGISIELGYAYVPGASDAPEDVLGFVDVPGHERLIHTMVAGATGIDFALLVVAADDGVMPQTREHVAILGVLGIARGAVAITKIDRVDAHRVQDVRAELAGLLAPTALCGVPAFEVDATDPDDAGVPALRSHLLAAAAQIPLRQSIGLFRLNIDRVFTLAGHGTVVAGIVVNGIVSVGDTVTVMPAGMSARVRSIHAQNRAAAAGRAGQRCALNLAHIDKTAVRRGDTLADARALTPTQRFDARLTLFSDARPLADWAAVHLHFGTTHCTARVVLLDAQRLAARESSRVQFVLDAPVCIAPGDRFIARDAQAARTLGGGILLDPFAPARKRRCDARMRRLTALERMVGGDGIGAVLQEATPGLAENELMQLSGTIIESAQLPGGTRIVATSTGRVVILDAHWQQLRARALSALRGFHSQTPDEVGPDGGRLRRVAGPEIPAPLWRALLDDLVQTGLIVQAGPWLRLPDHAVTLSHDERVLADKILPLVSAGGFDPPWTRDLAHALRESEESVRRTLRKLSADGAVLQVVRDLFFARDVVAELASIAAQVAGENGNLDVVRYRDRIGIGRKRSIQILEFFDRVGYTRRRRDARILRDDSGWRNALLPQTGAQDDSARKARAPGGAAGLQIQ